jgi:hypothetical protein
VRAFYFATLGHYHFTLTAENACDQRPAHQRHITPRQPFVTDQAAGLRRYPSAHNRGLISDKALAEVIGCMKSLNGAAGGSPYPMASSVLSDNPRSSRHSYLGDWNSSVRRRHPGASVKNQSNSRIFPQI